MILISAGHHAKKPGACYEGFCEFDEAEKWADLVVQHLGDKSARVPSGYLRDKVEFINSRNPTIAIEIHFNSAVADGKNIGEGCEVLHYPSSKVGIILAEVILESLEMVFPPSRGIKEGWYRMDQSKGVDFFLERTKCPSVIVEPQFIHLKENIQNRRAEACLKMADAIEDFLELVEIKK